MGSVSPFSLTLSELPNLYSIISPNFLITIFLQIKRKVSSMKKIFAVLISVLFLFSGCTAAQNNETHITSPVDYVKSVWMTYFELEQLTSSSDTSQDFENAVKEAFGIVKDAGLNTVTVQVRPCADAFYKSEYFPVSQYCFGEQGAELKYDPLEIMVSVAHSMNLRLEAWVNPYRVSQSNDINELCDTNQAKIWYQNDDTKSNVYISDKIYFNPASEAVTQLIVNGIKEIVMNYAVDGIHFDDYFYPTDKDDIDSKEYSAYVQGGGELSLADWRRENVSNMVKSVYSTVKQVNSSVQFGISPQSKVSTDYNVLYADVEKWASEEGYVDYICPQIYFGFYNEVQPFSRTAKEWSERTTAVKLYVGLPLYKAGEKDEFASSDQDYAINEFVDNNNIISRQIIYLDNLPNVGGYYIYSFSYLADGQSSAVKNEVENIKNLN